MATAERVRKAKVDPVDQGGSEGVGKTSRRPGRPAANESHDVSRASILKAALRLAKTHPLQDLSIVTVARSMKVTPALIHYYIGGRDWLTSGTMNLFYRDLLKKWPKETGDWQDDLSAAAKAIYEHYVLYAGIAAYVVSHSRFRVFQLTAFGDRDYGVETLERFSGRVAAAGLSGDRSGIYAHLFMEFIITTAHGAAHHIFPKEHRQFIEEKIAKLDPDKYPNIFFAGRAPVQIDGDFAFEEGCRLYMLGIASELGGPRSR
jgi:AcrR family transcriptional regulator